MLALIFDCKYTVELLIAEALFLIPAKRRGGYPLRAALSVLICLAVSVALDYGRMERWMPELYPLGGVLRYFAVIALTVVCIGFCFSIKPYRAALYMICGYCVQHIAYSLHQLLMLFVWMTGHGAEGETPGPGYWLACLLIYCAVYTSLYVTVIRPIGRQTADIQMRTVLVLSVGVLLNILVFSLCTYNLDGLQMVLFRLLSITTCLFALSIMKEWMEVRGLRQDMALLRHLSKLREDHYETLKDHIAATNLQCHDFKHQIARLRVMGQADDLSDTLDDLERSIEDYDAISQTGNEALDVVLTEKNTICRRNEIRFTYMVDSRSLSILSDRDIYSLFGNMLDNAIEAVEQLPEPERRVINLSVSSRGKLLSIQLCNYYATAPRMVDGMPETTKADSYTHGYGLKSIQMIALHYGGEMSVSAGDALFELNILIPIG